MRGEKPLNQQIFEAEAGVIARLAKHESCVILGRCADFVLHNERNVLTVFIGASDNFRKERGVTAYSGKTLADLDRENAKRAQYISTLPLRVRRPTKLRLISSAPQGAPPMIRVHRSLRQEVIK